MKPVKSSWLIKTFKITLIVTLLKMKNYLYKKLYESQLFREVLLQIVNLVEKVQWSWGKMKQCVEMNKVFNFVLFFISVVHVEATRRKNILNFTTKLQKHSFKHELIYIHFYYLHSYKKCVPSSSKKIHQKEKFIFRVLEQMHLYSLFSYINLTWRFH